MNRGLPKAVEGPSQAVEVLGLFGGLRNRQHTYDPAQAFFLAREKLRNPKPEDSDCGDASLNEIKHDIQASIWHPT